MPYEFKMTRRVEFADTDSAGLMHFSNFFRFMEMTEHAFFRSIGYSIHGDVEGRRIGWPRGQAECRFVLPLRFEDEVEIHLVVRDKKSKSVTYDFVFRKLNGGEGIEVARGSITSVCVELGPDARSIKAVDIPGAIADRIEIAPSHLQS